LSIAYAWFDVGVDRIHHPGTDAMMAAAKLTQKNEIMEILSIIKNSGFMPGTKTLSISSIASADNL
jgi:hypothetical protein